MITEKLLTAIREALDTLPDYEEGGLDDDQACDVAWAKGRLADALALAEADRNACAAVHREAA